MKEAYYQAKVFGVLYLAHVSKEEDAAPLDIRGAAHSAIMNAAGCDPHEVKNLEDVEISEMISTLLTTPPIALGDDWSVWKAFDPR